jgi:ketosteroid isomerase-like protein
MKRTTRIPALIAVVMMAIATLVQTASAQSSDERAIREASQAWQNYVARQQVDSIVAIHLPDAVLMIANSPPVKGSNSIRAGWGDMVKLPNLRMQWTPEKIELTSPTTATEYGTYTDSFDGPNGTESDAGPT